MNLKHLLQIHKYIMDSVFFMSILSMAVALFATGTLLPWTFWRDNVLCIRIFFTTLVFSEWMFFIGLYMWNRHDRIWFTVVIRIMILFLGNDSVDLYVKKDMIFCYFKAFFLESQLLFLLHKIKHYDMIYLVKHALNHRETYLGTFLYGLVSDFVNNITSTHKSQWFLRQGIPIFPDVLQKYMHTQW